MTVDGGGGEIKSESSYKKLCNASVEAHAKVSKW